MLQSQFAPMNAAAAVSPTAVSVVADARRTQAEMVLMALRQQDIGGSSRRLPSQRLTEPSPFGGAGPYKNWRHIPGMRPLRRWRILPVAAVVLLALAGSAS